MTYAIVLVTESTKAVKDKEGFAHIYQNKDTAESMCALMGKGFKVVPW